jgi:hypothetical protein
MEMKSQAGSTRKPPEPSDSHAVIDEWSKSIMPRLQPLVAYLDKLICETVDNLEYAVKWKKAHYGLSDQGWILELVAYDVSVNVVFYAGAEFTNPPELGTGRSRYVKIKSVEEAKQLDLEDWIKQAAKTTGWK